MVNLLPTLTAFMASCLFLALSSAAHADCATESEYQSLNMRALQSDLMVAALACQQKRAYNTFARRYGDELAWHGEEMRGYFSRCYGPRGERKMNRFVTEMANQASHESLQQSGSLYCRKAVGLFRTVNQATPWQLEEFAADRYPAWHKVMPCE